MLARVEQSPLLARHESAILTANRTPLSCLGFYCLELRVRDKLTNIVKLNPYHAAEQTGQSVLVKLLLS